MSTVADIVDAARSMLDSTPDDLTVLDQPYTPGDGNIKLRYPKPKLAPGSFVTVDLNTFYVLTNGSSGSVLEVLPKADGSPDIPVPAGSIVRAKPHHTTWSIFREVGHEIVAMSGPLSGLFGVKIAEYTTDWAWQTYPLPADFGPVTRLLEAEYKIDGSSDQWQRVSGAEYQAQSLATRLFGDVGGSTVRMTYAVPFTLPVSLSDDLADLGVVETMRDIPALGAAATLALDREGRRNSGYGQGDPRRPMEVQQGANIGVYRSWEEQKAARINEEHARLIQQYGYIVDEGVTDYPLSGTGYGLGTWY